MSGNNDDRLVTIRLHDRDPNLVYLDTPPTLATTMGRFRPARFVGARPGAYVVSIDQLETFHRFAAMVGLVVLDQRGSVTADRPYGRERPLPECGFCGQPARRGSTLTYCPACGEEWHPVEPVPAAEREALTMECPSCGRRQTRGFAHCGHCGSQLDPDPDDPDPFIRGPRRERLDEPVPIGAVLEELQLPLPTTP